MPTGFLLVQSHQHKPDLHPRKLLLSVFWDSKGRLYWEMLSSNQTINAALYTEQLQKLAEAVQDNIA